MTRARYWFLVAAAMMMFGEVAKDAPMWHMIVFGALMGLSASPIRKDKP
jgi:hypothetical protein